jgi:hypothetical protein
MRFRNVLIALAGLATLAGCSDNDSSTSPRPPLAGVRFINALADTVPVDIRMIDQIEWSAVANNLAYRAGTQHQPTEAKARRIRVFTFITANPGIGVVSQQLLDTTITLTANTNVTLLLTGSARARTVRMALINDDPPVPPAGQIAVRMVNASTGAIDAYYLPTATTAISGAPSTGNLASLAVSPYVLRPAEAVAVRTTASGSTTAAASTAGPVAPAVIAGASPGAGVNSAGSAFSVYYFGPGVAGSPQAGVTTPTVTWFVDRVPPPPAAP